MRPEVGSNPVASDDLNMLQRALLAQQRGAHPPAWGASALQPEQLRANAATAPGVPTEVPGEQYLAFTLLDLEFAFKAEYIQSVERLLDVTPVPNVAPWVRGVINLRGSIASVVDLRTFLDREPLPYNPRTRLLSVQYNEMVICLVVDSVSEMLPIPDNVIASVSTRQTNIPLWVAPYAAGTAVLGKRVIVLLDAARLLFSEKMQHYEALD
ncbi:chemotaxis protein CheW [Thermogemmatispora sp.]|uniref:chemotaxis protein CheW n=1 Tax=Thermogemmatispora sp. TaxID=1968838 RepID=UPI0035E42487